MKRFLAVIALLGLPLMSASAYFEGGVDETFGSFSYAGTAGYAELGAANGLYFKPRFNLYKSDFSTGTYSSIYGRIGYDTPFFAIGTEAGGTPKKNGYSNTSVSGDATFTLTSGGGVRGRLAGPNSKGEEGRSAQGLTRIDIGGVVTYRAHREDSPAPAAQMKLGQTDVGAFAGIKFFGLRASGEIIRSTYDKSIPAGMRPQPNTELVGVRNQTIGFTDFQSNIRIEGTKFFLLSPFLSYTYTKFKLNQPSSRAVEVGTAVNLDMIDVRGSYQYYDSGGFQPKQHFVSLGASINF